MERDKERYDAICKQIEREDGLYNTRFNFWVILNLALAAAAATQIQSDGPFASRVVIFLGACIVATGTSFLMNELLQSGSRQLADLRDEYWKGFYEGKFDGLPRPFFAGETKMDRYTPKGWSTLPFFVLSAWLLAAVVGSGLLFMSAQEPPRNEKCLIWTSTSS